MHGPSPSTSGTSAPPTGYTALPISPTYADFAEKQQQAVANNRRRRSSFASISLSLPPPSPTVAAGLHLPRARATRPLLRVLGGLVGLVIVLGVGVALAGPDALPEANKVAKQLKQHLAPVGDFVRERLGAGAGRAEDRMGALKEARCNPYVQPGRLWIDEKVPANNIWRPFDEASCPPSTFLADVVAGLSSFAGEARAPPNALFTRPSSWEDEELDEEGRLPWLVNATILLVGDSIDRLHAQDFCSFVGGNVSHITPTHPASPPTYRKEMPVLLDSEGRETPESVWAREARRRNEDRWELKKEDWGLTRPTVCDVAKYGATIVTVFTWGMDDAEDIFAEESFFYGPSSWLDRFRHVTLPLLSLLADYLDRPQILQPDLIELSSGFWDLRQWTERDFTAAGYYKPFPKDSDIAFGMVGVEREKKWEKQVREAVKEVAKHFVDPESGKVRDGPMINWRALHQPKRNNYTPYARTPVLDQLGGKIVRDLQHESLARRSSQSLWGGSIYRRAGTSEFKEDGLLVSPDKEEPDYGFDERLRIDNWGHLLLGTQHTYRDFLHPNVYPGNYLWGDMMLRELKRSRARVGRTKQ